MLFEITDALLGAILGILLMIYHQLGGIKMLQNCMIGSLNEVREKLGLAPFRGGDVEV